MPTPATALLEGLKAHDASEIVGIPSNFVFPFFKVIEENRIVAAVIAFDCKHRHRHHVRAWVPGTQWSILDRLDGTTQL